MPVYLGTVGGLGNRWAVQRSYVHGFATNWPPDCTVTTDDGDWRITLPAAYNFNYKRIQFHDYVWSWTSSRFFFEKIFANYYVYFTLTDTIGTPEPISLHYRLNPDDGYQYLALDVGFWTDWYYITLPGGPPGWWSQPPSNLI